MPHRNMFTDKVINTNDFFFLQSENPTSVLTVGGATSSAALWRSTRSDVTTTSSAWGCRTASTQVGALRDTHLPQLSPKSDDPLYRESRTSPCMCTIPSVSLSLNAPTGPDELLPFLFELVL